MALLWCFVVPEKTRSTTSQPFRRSSCNVPAVSVIMANHNSAAFLPQALSSVLSQSVSNIEVIVADDASSDESCAILERISAVDDRVKVLLSKVNSGPAAARNRALDAARGDWIAVVDADDMIHPRRFERLLNVANSIEADGIADDLIFFSTACSEPARTLMAQDALERPRQVTARWITISSIQQGQTPMGYLKPLMRRASIGKMRYREDLRVGEDHDFYLRYILSGAPLFVTPEAYYLYRRHPDSISHRLLSRDIRAMIAAQMDVISSAPRLSIDLQEVFEARVTRLGKDLAFACLVEALKSGQLVSSVRTLFRHPGLFRPLLKAISEHYRQPSKPTSSVGQSNEDLVLLTESQVIRDIPASVERVPIPARPDSWSAKDWARLTARAAGQRKIYTEGAAGFEALGYVPDWRVAVINGAEPARSQRGLTVFSPTGQRNEPSHQDTNGLTTLSREERPMTNEADCTLSLLEERPLVHIRTPTYKRPEILRRCLNSLQDQTVGDWICDVYDDDPDASARDVVKAIGDRRIRYTHNQPQKRASKNIDQCFTRKNPHNADFFCVVEDDNFILPRFIEENIRICREEGVEIVFRNQLIEFASGTDRARISDFGILDKKLREGLYSPDKFRLALLAGIGVSNGGLFWSRMAKSDLEIHHKCSATLQEYMRTFAIIEPIYSALEPLAVWAENGLKTTRDEGISTSWFFRELSLKRSIQKLQIMAWNMTPCETRSQFLSDPEFVYSASARARGLVKSHLQINVGTALSLREKMRLLFRGMLIRWLGRPEPGLRLFLRDQASLQNSG